MGKVAAVVTALLIGTVAASEAFAQRESAPGRLRAKGAFVAYDADARTVSVRERKVIRTYAVIPEGDEPEAETRVTIEGKRARLDDLEAGAPILISWRQDAEDPARREALRLEVPTIPRSFREDLR